MKVNLEPGKYVIAVSGGVDSVVLLDILSKLSGLELFVAHFDHGIRSDSGKDREFVEDLAKKYNLKFYFKKGQLGADASEALAREKRYEFLNKVLIETGSDAIVTAHHQDDILETAIINLLRGTGRKGLSSLKSTENIKRPLLEYSKKQILDYAQKNKLQWREDPSNQDTKYLRNYVRQNIVTKLNSDQKRRLLSLINKQNSKNKELDSLITTLLQYLGTELDQKVFVSLPHEVAKEMIAQILRREKLKINKKTVERLVVSLKTVGDNKRVEINKNRNFMVQKGKIKLI